jgi:hypothetical protein
VVGSAVNGTAAGGVMLHEVKVVEGTTPPDWPSTGERHDCIASHNCG